MGEDMAEGIPNDAKELFAARLHVAPSI